MSTVFERHPHPRSVVRLVSIFSQIVLWTAFVVFFLDVLSNRLRINHDCALHLHAGLLLTQGKLPFVDIVDTNPPMIAYLSVIPVLVSRASGIHVILVFSTMALVLALVSALALRCLLLRFPAVAGRIAGNLAPLVWFLFSISLYAEFYYGQREHLFMLCYVPFFFMRYRQWRGERLSPLLTMPVAFAAAVASCLKPHFLLLVLAQEAYWALSKRNLRVLAKSETFVYVSAVLVYALHFFVAPAAMREAMWTKWLPLMNGGGYKAYNSSLSFVLANPLFLASIPIAVAAFFSPSLTGDMRADLRRPLALVTLAGDVIYVFQWKGFPYHLIPAFGMFSLLVLFMLVQQARILGRANTANRFLRCAWMFGLLLLLCGMWVSPGGRWQYYPEWRKWEFEQERPLEIISLVTLLSVAILIALPALSRSMRDAGRGAATWMRIARAHAVGWTLCAVEIVLLAWGGRLAMAGFPLKALSGDLPKVIMRESRENDPVLFLSTSVYPAYPLLVILNRMPGSRFLVTFPIAFFYAGSVPGPDGKFVYRERDTMPPIEKTFLNDLAEDVGKLRSSLILVHNTAAGTFALPAGFVIHDYLLHCGFVQTAMKDYSPLCDCQGFKVYKRKDPK